LTYPRHVVERALALIRDGRSLRSVGRELGVSPSTLRHWIKHPDGALDRPEVLGFPCPEACSQLEDLNHADYSYLLGMYLGDGCISRSRSSFRLRIVCDRRYKGVITEVTRAIEVVSGSRPYLIEREGCVEVAGDWIHWLCLFPQHGPGPKHARTIRLTDWQEGIVRGSPHAFVRGLLHSDGCRVMNNVRRPLKNGTKTYRYTRYHFSNRSEDIKSIFQWACELIGLATKRASWKEVTVNRREDVRLLDTFVGPKR